MIKAILFDMDGTLVDSENADNTVALEICKKLGFQLTPKEQEERHGRTTKSFYEYLLKKRNADFDLEQTIKDQLVSFEKELIKGVGSFPGAKKLPKMLAVNDYKLAVVSGSTTAQINIILNALGVKDFFNVIVSADDITESKPNPEGYLLAARKLGVLPKNCAVLEDGTKGIHAGKNAGMKVIGIINNGGQDLSLADITVKNLEKINIKCLKTYDDR